MLKFVKSKLFLKAMIVAGSMIFTYSLILLFFIIPKVENSIRILEEKNAKEVLNNIVVLTNNYYKNIENYKKLSLEKYKNELKSVTDVAFSLIEAKYEQSKSENVANILKERGEIFHQFLIKYYNDNKDKMSEKELKNRIKNYVNIYRYSNGIGYFWINDFSPKMILHPIIPKLNGKYLGNYRDKTGIYLFNKMVEKVKKEGCGIVKYNWLNPASKKVEEKISFVFEFKPFHWIIGTGEYKTVLQNRLKNEVIDLVSKLRYGNGNYFFIYNYKNIAISHPYIQGKDMSNFRDVRGKLVVPEIIRVAREKGEGFTNYYWYLNGKDGKTAEKLTFSKNFSNWKMVIATGIFINEINKEVERRKKELLFQLKNIVYKTKIGEEGYLAIFDEKGNIVMHPNSKINGTNFSKSINPTTKNFLFNDLVEVSKTDNKFLKYKWNKIDDNEHYIYNKIAWVKYVPKLHWYIVASVYEDDFKEKSNKIRKFILLLSLFLFIFIFILTFIFLKRLLEPVSKLSYLSLKVSKGDYNAKCRLKRDDEIGDLSNSFNKMIDTTKDLIENLDKKIELRTNELKIINKHMQDSIKFAFLIQESILPNNSILNNYTEDYFIVWKPKDIVGGDIYFIIESKNREEVFLIIIDGVGHGVSGAFVTMLVKAISEQILFEIDRGELEATPSAILKYFNQQIKIILKQDKGFKSNIGFDGAVLYYNKQSKKCEFSGAKIDLYILNNGELEVVKGDRKSVGFSRIKMNQEFTNNNIDIKDNTQLYITTDGVIDQEGESGKRYKSSRLKKIIIENYDKSFKEQKKVIMEDFNKFKGENPQTDDITLVGLKFR